jgi:ferritin
VKLSQELNEVLNLQISHELRNVTKYMQIASFFENLQLKNLAKYFKDQSNQEKEHADKFMQHINDRIGGMVSLEEIDSPNLKLFDVSTVADAFVDTEVATTESIEAIYSLAFDEKSFIDLPFLMDMLNEQVEEEDSAQAFAEKVKASKDLVLFDATFGG